MSVRQSLLAILDQGPCYGYQLRHEFDRRTGSTWPLNVGQIYNTLERLERDGLVQRGEADDHGHVYWRITPAGSAEAARWLTTPVLRAPATREELAVKLAVAATLPGVDAAAILRSQRDADVVRPMAYNQGFYNLFLAGGSVVGLALYWTTLRQVGFGLIFFCGTCMVLASFVLVTTGRRYWRPALLQGALPLAALILLVIAENT